MVELTNKRVTVAGLGHFGGGIAVARWLCERGARVLVTDKEPAEKFAGAIAKLANLPIEFRLGGHRPEDFTKADLVVTSPAIPPHNDYLIAAREAGVPITTEIRLFIERCPAKIVGVTGTKGKSTCSAMLRAILETRHKTWFGGNIGGSLLPDLPRMTPSDLVVLELSSYMLHYLGEVRWSPHVAVVTMVSADHLSWHGGREAYVEAKRNILRFQTADDQAVLNEEDEAGLDFAKDAKGKVTQFGLRHRVPFDLQVPGPHNQLNAQAAFAAASLMGIDWEQTSAALQNFRGLPHRLQLVHESNGVRYFNDSIATIPQAAVAALDSFPQDTVIQIIGGRDKDLDLQPMVQALASRAKAVLCIGEEGPRLAKLINAVKGRRAGVHDCGNLEHAMEIAREIAITGDVVLLATGFASYDQFVNFEERGDAFARRAKSHSSDQKL